MRRRRRRKMRTMRHSEYNSDNNDERGLLAPPPSPAPPLISGDRCAAPKYWKFTTDAILYSMSF